MRKLFLISFIVLLPIWGQQYTVPNSAGGAPQSAVTANTPWVCTPTSASGTVYVCNTNATLTRIDGTAIGSTEPTNGQVLLLVPDVTNTASFSIKTGTLARGAFAQANNPFIASDIQGTSDSLATIPYTFVYDAPDSEWIQQGGVVLSAGVGIAVTRTNGMFNPSIALVTSGVHAPLVRTSGRLTGVTAASGTVANFTVGAADSSFLVSANVNITASTTHNFTVTVAYTDEGNTARTLTLNFSQVTGTLLTAITNVQGAGAYEGVPLHIRCKASTSLTIQTNAGTFTSVTYNIEGYITQIG